MIAHDPLHRSGRAALPHPAPTSGEDAQTHEGIRVADTSRRKPPRDQTGHAVPRQVLPLTATAQNRPPKVPHGLAERAERRTIHGYTVVAGVAQDDRAQVGTLLRDGRVQALPQFGVHRPQLGLPPLAHRLSQHRGPAFPRLPAAMREAQKVEGSRFPLATLSPISFRIATELDDPRFVVMQSQSELRQTLAQLREKLLRLPTILKAHDEVVGKADDDHVAARLLLPPSLNPEVEYVVQVDVRQQWTDASNLERSPLHFVCADAPPARPWSTHRLRGRAWISRLNTRPARTPVNASPSSSRTPTLDSEPLWVASPSTYETFIHNTLPV